MRGVVGQPTLFDDGGWLQPGLTTVLNATRRPEPVLTNSQLAALASGESGGRSVSVMEGATVIVSDPVDIDMLAARQEFAARSAAFG